MAALIHELDKRAIEYKICVTGQHREMLDQALEFFEITPDFDLDLMKPGQSLNDLSSSILSSVDKVLEEVKPNLVLVHGDTTTSFITALASFHKGIKVGHVEAGLRTYNKSAPFPEELNRQLTARLSDFHFAPTENARKNLINEKIAEDGISITGNTIVDSLKWGLQKLEANNPAEVKKIEGYLDGSKKLILVTGHRRENFGNGIKSLCRALISLAKTENVEIVFPVHLNPRVLNDVEKELKGQKNIYLLEPVNYPTMLWLMNRCDLIISDSGGIQEEAPTFNKPLIVTRQISERMEGVEAGYSFLIGPNEEEIIKKSKTLLSRPFDMKNKRNPYGDGKAAQRIVDILMGNI